MCGPACDKGTQERKSKRRHYYSGEQKLEKIETRRLSNVALENRLEYNGNKWGIITLYRQKIEETMEVLFEYIEENIRRGGRMFSNRRRLQRKNR